MSLKQLNVNVRLMRFKVLVEHSRAVVGLVNAALEV